MLDVAGRAEEPLRRVERGRVDTTGHDPAAGRGGQVVGAAEAGDRVEQHDDVVAHLDQPLGALDGQLGDRGVVLGGTVEGRVDDLALDRALHVGDFLRALVHQDDHEVALGVVLRDRVGDGLQDHRLARLGRGHDEPALALADRADQVDDPRGHDDRVGLQPQPLLRVQRDELGELGAGLGLLGVQAVDLVQADERVELLAALAFLGLADRALDHVALAQAVLADLGQRDVHVVGAGQVAGGADERVVVEDVQDAGDRDQDVVLADHRLGVAAAVPAPALAVAAVAVAEPVPAAAAAALVVVPAALVVTAAALLVAVAALLVLATGGAVAAAAVAVAAALVLAALVVAAAALLVAVALRAAVALLLTAVGGAVLALLVVAAAVVPAAPVLAALAAVALAAPPWPWLWLAAPSDWAPSAGALAGGWAAGAAGLIPGPLTTTELTVTEPALAAGPPAVVAEGPPDGPARLEPGRGGIPGLACRWAAVARRRRLLSHGVLLNRAGRAGSRGRASLE